MLQLHILLVDDEAPARRKLVNFLKKEEAVSHLSEASNGEEAIQMINQEKPDLVLLDIQMPGKNGFEVIEAVGVTQMPPVIFVTAFDEFALQAFSVHAVDYLLKPFDRERFQHAFHRAVEQIKMKHNQATLLEDLIKAVRPLSSYVDRLMVNEGDKIIFVPIDAIIYLKADDKYVEIQTAQKRYLIRDTLNGLEAKLNPAYFARIHRSHIVNLDAILQLSPRSHGDYWVNLKNGTRLILSRRYRANVFK